MIFLLLSIVATSCIFLIFKWLGRIKANTFLVIVINYLFAGLVGWFLEGDQFLTKCLNSEWISSAVLLGSSFIGMFYLMAITTQRAGTSSAVVANKMSVVIPVIAAFFLYNDNLSFIKILGILMAMIGIFLVTRNKDLETKWGRNFYLLLILFVGSGLIDTFIKLIEENYLDSNDVIAFTSVIFITAFLMGFLVLLLRIKKTISSFVWKKVLIGLMLGAVNFGSIYFLVIALKESGLESSVLFPLNNIGIVCLSTVLSIVLFKEHLTRGKVIGIVISVLSLITLMMAR